MNKTVSEQLVEKTLKELSAAEKPQQNSRIWQESEGYQRLGAWQNAALLRVLIRLFTKGCLPRSEYRLKAQLDDAARSVKRNIEEGWKRPTTKEYLTFLGYSQASLLPSKPLSTLKDTLNIDLRVTKGIDIKGEPTEPTHPYYQPLTTLKSSTLTYEIFLELINKTDWLLRKLVESLERKLQEDKLKI